MRSSPGTSRRASALTPLALALGCAAPPEPPYVEPTDAASLYAPHRGSAFFNPWQPFSASVWQLLRWQLFSSNPYDKERAPVIPKVANDGAYLSGVAQEPSLTWIGHATLALHDGDDVILTDPHFGERAMVPRRIVAPGVPLEAIPADAFAVISHNHYDHLDAYTVETLPASVTWYVPLGLADWFRERGRMQVVELDWWQSATRGRWTITCLPSQHWSRRGVADTNEALWCSWLLESGQRRYYFAGDTGYFHGFREFGRRYGPIDVAMLPIGAYAPRWFMKYQHMNPAEALRAFADLDARYFVPMHWGTFDLTDEPADLPPRVLADAVSRAGADPERVRTLAIGERWELPQP